MFENLSRYRAIIVSTYRKLYVEVETLTTLFQLLIFLVGYSETIDTPVQTLDQRSVKLISVARYSPETITSTNSIN